MFIHSRSSLETHTQFQTKEGKMCTRLKSMPVFRPGLLLSLQKLCHLLRLEREQKDFLKCISNSHISLCFFFHLKLKRQIRSYTPVVSSKTIPNSRSKRANLYPSKIHARFQTWSSSFSAEIMSST